MTDPFTTRFLARLPPTLARSFNADQLDAIQTVFGARYRMEHALDVRRTLALPWGRYYLVVLFGRDHRRDDRRHIRRAEGAFFDTLGMIGLAAFVVVSLLVVGEAVTSFFAAGDFINLAGG